MIRMKRYELTMVENTSECIDFYREYILPDPMINVTPYAPQHDPLNPLIPS